MSQVDIDIRLNSAQHGRKGKGWGSSRNMGTGSKGTDHKVKDKGN